MTTTEPATVPAAVNPHVEFAPGALVRARGREWVVLPGSDGDLLLVRPLGGGDDDTAAILRALEPVTSATFSAPTAADLGDATSAALLHTALRIGFRSTAGPFRSLARLGVEPRAYQFVPLMLALRQPTTRVLIADDVGVGKTIEAGLIAAELLAQGDVQRLAVLCSPALAEQWQGELRQKFAIDAELVIPSTATRLTRGLLLNESLFDRHPFVVVSTDFIKSHQRRQEFINHCPELVIIDEAHGVVADGSGAGGARTQRFELARAVADDPHRHLVLVTATPHSGKEQGFRNLIGLLDKDLATVDLEQVKGRELLARHMVQRRRADIRRYLNEDTQFPSDRATLEVPYTLTRDYAALFEKVLTYAREQVTDSAGPTGVRQRVRWWSVLALLRALSSSPKAAAATLRNRANGVGAATVEEADALGRAAVLDSGDDESLENLDTVPGADDSDIDTGDPNRIGEPNQELLNHKRRLLRLAVEAEGLADPIKDRKLKTLIEEVKGLLADGFDPIVFCRFIDTATYVADHLGKALKSAATVIAVTGSLPPEERAARVAALGASDGRHVLVATDCLSEGVNLQDHFHAVVHYDLAWNPTRHEQREGRVDRFGQTRDIVRAVTIYGRNNGIDGIVLDVLIRKHREISKATGVSVPVPDTSDSVVAALMEGLVLRGRRDAEQLTLDLGEEQQAAALHRQWESAAEREKLSHTKYAHEGIKPDDVALEVHAARELLGSHHDVEQFISEAVRALGGSVTPTGDGLSAVTATLPVGLRDELPAGHRQPLPFHRDLPLARGEALLARTDPHVEAVARFVLDTALDRVTGPVTARSGAARAGVMRTNAVTRRTTLLLVRFRFHLELPTKAGPRPQITEDARFLAFAGSPAAAEWLDASQLTELRRAEPAANLSVDAATQHFERIIEGLDHLRPHLQQEAERGAATLLEAHRRVRVGAGAPLRGLKVQAHHDVDLLGVYVLVPNATVTAGAGR